MFWGLYVTISAISRILRKKSWLKRGLSSNLYLKVTSNRSHGYRLISVSGSNTKCLVFILNETKNGVYKRRTECIHLKWELQTTRRTFISLDSHHTVKKLGSNHINVIISYPALQKHIRKRPAFKTVKELSTSNRWNNLTKTPACGLEQNCFLANINSF